MTNHSTDPVNPSQGRRGRLQSRLEVAVGRGELSMEEYDDLCTRVWDAGCDDASPELDAIAGRLERIESERPADAAPGSDPLQIAQSTNPYRQPDPYLPRPEGALDRTANGAALVGRTPDDQRQDGRPAIFSDKSLTGRWAPRATTTWWELFGDVKLDLREADWPSERIVLDFQSAMSDTTIIVPPGTVIVDETTAILSDVKIKTSRTAPANGLTVVLDGVLIFGDLKVKDH